MKNVQWVYEQLEKAFPGDKVTVFDERNDDQHLKVCVESMSFRGKSLIESHRIVYQALGDAVGNRIHALSVETRSPSE